MPDDEYRQAERTEQERYLQLGTSVAATPCPWVESLMGHSSSMTLKAYASIPWELRVEAVSRWVY